MFRKFWVELRSRGNNVCNKIKSPSYRSVNHFCDFSNSSSVMGKRNSPSDPIFPSVTNGLEKFDSAGKKRTFAASIFSNSEHRMLISTNPPLYLEPLYMGMLVLVMSGKLKESYGNKTHGLCAATNCIFVISNFHAPGIINDSSISRHFESKLHFHSLGNPRATSRSVTLTGESFSAIK